MRLFRPHSILQSLKGSDLIYKTYSNESLREASASMNSSLKSDTDNERHSCPQKKNYSPKNKQTRITYLR